MIHFVPGHLDHCTRLVSYLLKMSSFHLVKNQWVFKPASSSNFIVRWTMWHSMVSEFRRRFQRNWQILSHTQTHILDCERISSAFGVCVCVFYWIAIKCLLSLVMWGGGRGHNVTRMDSAMILILHWLLIKFFCLSRYGQNRHMTRNTEKTGRPKKKWTHLPATGLI